MDLKQVMAIVRTDVLEEVERRLRHAGVPGITVARVKGFGEYANFLTPDWKSAYARIDILVDEAHARHVIDVIAQTARTGRAGDGIVAVLPVDNVYRIRDYRELDTLHAPHVRDEESGDSPARSTA